MTRSDRIATRLWESGVCAGFGVLSTIAGATGALKSEGRSSGSWVTAGVIMLIVSAALWSSASCLCRLADEGEE